MSGEAQKDGLSEIITVARAMAEGDFQKDLNLKLQGELGDLARYIDKMRRNLQKLDPALTESSVKIPSASSQLYDVTRVAEEGTHKVMSITERLLDEHEAVSGRLKELKVAAAGGSAASQEMTVEIAAEIEAINSRNKNDLIEIITALSFQDITGQKIKKIVTLVEEVEARILEILVSFGIRREGGEAVETMMEQVREVTRLDGNQGAVDDLLKNLGL